MKVGVLGRSCCTRPAAMCFWAAMFVLIHGAGLLVRSAWPPVQAFGDTFVLVALAAACTITFRRNGTLHCAMTAPLFLLGAVAAALIEAGTWQFDMALAWGAILVGVGISFIVEWRTSAEGLERFAVNLHGAAHIASEGMTEAEADAECLAGPGVTSALDSEVDFRVDTRPRWLIAVPEPRPSRVRPNVPHAGTAEWRFSCRR